MMNKRRDAIPTVRAAEYLQCSTRHIRNLFWSGSLTGYFKGEKTGLMIYRESLHLWKNREMEE